MDLILYLGELPCTNKLIIIAGLWLISFCLTLKFNCKNTHS